MSDIFNALSAIPEGILAIQNHPRATFVVQVIAVCVIVGVRVNVSSKYTYEQKAAEQVPAAEDHEIVRIRTHVNWTLKKEDSK